MAKSYEYHTSLVVHQWKQLNYWLHNETVNVVLDGQNLDISDVVFVSR
jgi:N-dimethylarginine dimethylaminohydrolase